MADITAAMVKELREKTGAGMMDAKKALVDCDGSMEDAVDFLRKKGLAKAEKKSSRTAAEGLVAVALSDDAKTGVTIEINAETDFVSRNEQFQAFVNKVAQIALTVSDIDALKAAEYDAGKTVEAQLTDLIATIGENMSIRRMEKLTVNSGRVAYYIHNALTSTMGKIAVLVALESDASDSDKLDDLGKKIAMHAAAAFPKFLNKDSVDQASLNKERDFLKEQAIASGKPAEIAEKMVEGRMRKYYEEVCLLEQIFVVDGENKISKVVEDLAKETGSSITLSAYARYQLGEGIEKKEEDFAAEVAAVANA